MGVFGQQETFTTLFGCFRREQQGGGNPELLLLFLTEQGKVTHREEVSQQELGEHSPWWPRRLKNQTKSNENT